VAGFQVATGSYIAGGEFPGNESDQVEVHVRSFPEVNKLKKQIFTNGGCDRLWSLGSVEIYYQNCDHFSGSYDRNKARV
jgi:hypothetical protein